jgi:ATP-dependent exoDNAse (exonuclease V) beta subunit
MLKNLRPKGRTLYFNEEKHKYTDEFNSNYISVTTLIGKYTSEFKAEKIAEACERIGRNPSHPKYQYYKDKSKKEILREWRIINEKACERGNKKHNYLENIIRNSTNYKSTELGYINDKIYTIDDIICNHNYGKLKLDYFEKTKLNETYPKIYNIIKEFSNIGYKIYSEIGVYDFELCISGLIDILLVKGEEFVILDWKTNKSPLMFDAGYFTKDVNGNLTNEFIKKDEYFASPLDYVQDSVGEHYTMQLSIYAYLVETFGYKCNALVLTHIRSITEDKEEVKFYNIKYIKNEVQLLLNHYSTNNIDITNKLF